MPQQQNTLALFTRFPTPGSTKTRLISALGPEGAASLHRRMSEGVLCQALHFCRISGTGLEIHFHGGSLEAMRQWLGPHAFIRQQSGSLGKRMASAFRRAFASGASKAAIIGADCPGITSDIIHQAFAALQDHQLVLGPAWDGGYYLIGLNSPCPSLFANIDWGTSAVLRQTLARAQSLTIYQLPTLHDIDRPEDLPHLDHHSHPR